MKCLSREIPWQVEVDCYSGYKGEQEPRRFRWGGQTYEVTEICDRWYSPEATYFRVVADDGNLYVIRQSAMGSWTLEAFRRIDSKLMHKS